MEKTVMEPLREPIPDHKLIRRIISGDQRAGYALYNQYANRLYGFVFSLVENRYAADEVFGETWVRFSKSLRRKMNWEGHPNIKSFLFKLAKRIVIDRWKKERNKPVIEFDDTKVKPPKSCDKMLKIITLCLMELSEKQRQAIILLHYDGLTRKEIAIEMKINYKKVCDLITNGYDKLRQLVNKEIE